MYKLAFSAIISSAILLACNDNNKTEQTTTTKDSTVIAAPTPKPVDTVSTTATTETSDAHNSQNSVDWNGTYFGTLPCASCEGIETTITLNTDNTYTIVEKYLGESGKNEFKESGKFTWDKSGQNITMTNKDGNRKYFVGENKIIAVGKDGKIPEGDFGKLYELVKK